VRAGKAHQPLAEPTPKGIPSLRICR
jgi:hypothetical protein